MLAGSTGGAPRTRSAKCTLRNSPWRYRFWSVHSTAFQASCKLGRSPLHARSKSTSWCLTHLRVVYGDHQVSSSNFTTSSNLFSVSDLMPTAASCPKSVCGWQLGALIPGPSKRVPAGFAGSMPNGLHDAALAAVGDFVQRLSRLAVTCSIGNND
jgi:hypothetical protein